MFKARLIFDPPRDAVTNMAVDEALFKCAASSPYSATLRLYGWARPSISLGRRQKMSEVLNLSACEAAGVEVVKRPGGGAAVYHDNELTYAFVCRLADLQEPSAESWRKIFSLFLEKLGLKADAAGNNVRGPVKFEACFSLAEEDEPTINGKKFVGSARRRSRSAFLQHGSILLQARPGYLGRFLKKPEQESSVGLLDLMPGLSVEEISAEFVCAVGETLGLCLQSGNYSEEETGLQKGRGQNRL